MTEVLAAPVRVSRHRSISPHRRLELGKEYSPYRTPNITQLGNALLSRAGTNPSIILRKKKEWIKDHSPLLTSRRETKKTPREGIHEQTDISPLRISQFPEDLKHIHKGSQISKVTSNSNSTCNLAKVASATSTPTATRRRAWTLESNKRLKSALNCSPMSSPGVHRKKRSDTSPQFHFASLPSSRQSSSKSSNSLGYKHTKTFTYIPKEPQRDGMDIKSSSQVQGQISKKEKNIHIVSSPSGPVIVEEKVDKTDVDDVNNDIAVPNNDKDDKVGDKGNVEEGQASVPTNNNAVRVTKKTLPMGLSVDVYHKCLRWLDGVRAAVDDKCLVAVTQPDLQWKDE